MSIKKQTILKNPYFVPPAGIEPAHMAPEAIALSTELRGRIEPSEYMKLPYIKQSKIDVHYESFGKIFF